jgi:hypothetical protein
MRILALLAAMLSAGSAAAQKPADTNYVRTTRLDITEDEVVDGATLTPGDAWVSVRTSSKHPSMLPIRRHFLPEMLRTVELH